MDMRNGVRENGKRVFTNFRLPEYRPVMVEYVSFFRRFDGRVEMELLYTPWGWIPTWKLPREKIKEIADGRDVDVTFVIRVLEGSILKRVTQMQDGETVSKLFIVTRFGLIEQIYDCERGIYVIGRNSGRYYSLRTGLKVEDVLRN